jgi:hypothetical protein
VCTIQRTRRFGKRSPEKLLSENIVFQLDRGEVHLQCHNKDDDDDDDDNNNNNNTALPLKVTPRQY